MDRIKNIYRNSCNANLDTLEWCIHNASDELWERKVGGDYYWHQVYHTVFILANRLVPDGMSPNFPIKSAGILNNEENLSEPHDKQLVLDFLRATKVQVNRYMDELDTETLFDEVDFFGKKIQKLGIIERVNSHIRYHIGGCDVILRDNGCKPI